MTVNVVDTAETERLLARLRENTERRIREGFRNRVYWRDAELRALADRINPQPVIPDNVSPIRKQVQK